MEDCKLYKLFREKWTNFCVFLAAREDLFYNKLSKAEQVIYDSLLDPQADSNLVEDFLKRFLCDPSKITISEMPVEGVEKLFPSLSKEFWVDFNKRAEEEGWNGDVVLERIDDARKLERYIEFFAVKIFRIDLDSCRRAAAESLARRAQTEPQTPTETAEEAHS